MDKDIVFRISENQLLYISLRDFIVLIILFAFAGFLLVYIIYSFFGKGKEKKIKIVEKWTAKHKLINFYRGREETAQNFLVKCVYLNSKYPDKIHTFGCETQSVYNALKEGKTYTVNIKLLHIVKIRRKK